MERSRDWKSGDWILVWAELLISCVTLGKLLYLEGPQIPFQQREGGGQTKRKVPPSLKHYDPICEARIIPCLLQKLEQVILFDLEIHNELSTSR